jgi:hypothetical protein
MSPTIRWVLIVAGIAGVLFSSAGFLDSVMVIKTNSATEGSPVGLRDHYQQIGFFYSRGFTTGFFLCFSIMLVAISVGTYFDERRRLRRESVQNVATAAPRLVEGTHQAS